MTWLRLIVANWKLLGLAALLAALGWQTMRVDRAQRQTAEVRSDLAASRTDLANFRATAAENVSLALRAARAEEARRDDNTRKAINAAKSETLVARADAVRASATADGLSRQLATFRAAARRAAADPAAAGGGPAASAALDLLADLLGGSGKVLVELGAFADDAYIAGRTCERIADGLEPVAQTLN